MKKILVVLLILAVAGGVFAQQGDWSLSGSVEVGTRINIDPQPDIDDDDPALTGGNVFNGWQTQRGVFRLSYSRDVFNSGVELNGDNWGSTNFYTAFDGENYSAKFAFNALDGIIGSSGGTTKIDQLWGEYRFLNGMVILKAAYNTGWSGGDWHSDGSGAWADTGDRTDGFDYGQGVAFTTSAYGFSQNQLKAAVNLEALNFGIMIPNLFRFGASEYSASDKVEFVNGSLRQSVFGLKFAQSPFEFAAQFALAKLGVYFGGKYFAGPITVGLSFMGELDGDSYKTPEAPNDADYQHIKFGGSVGYNGGDFGGGVLAFYEKKDEEARASDWYYTVIAIEPDFFYNAIPSHLQFKLNVGFYFFNATNGTVSEKATVWSLKPQIFWNFLGTGAGDWGVSNTGIAIRYRMSNADLREVDTRDMWGLGVNKSQNSLEFLFRWGF